MNRNFQNGSIFDGFQGASATNCLSGNFAGLFEHSEPEVRNETWVQTTFRNIKFANNIHSNGGLFMWPPGAYTPARVALPYPPYGTLNFFDQTATHVLDGIKWPPRHDDRPAADRPRHRRALLGRRQLRGRGVLHQRDHRFRLRDRDHQLLQRTRRRAWKTTCSAGQQPPFGDSTNDCLDNEGFHEAQEYASGNYGMLEAAMDYRGDTTAPVVHGDRQRPSAHASRRCASPPTRRARSTTRSTARPRPRPRPSGSRPAPARCRCRSRSRRARR